MRKIFGIVGWSGSGKTELIKNLIKIFTTHYNLKVCAIKHAHENFKIDQEGKDTYKFYEAGASKIIISSSKQWATINRVVNNNELSLDNLLKYSTEYDLVLVEGWKYSNLDNKIEVFREINNKPLLYENDNKIIAIASDKIDSLEEKKVQVPLLDLNNFSEIAKFIIKYEIK